MTPNDTSGPNGTESEQLSPADMQRIVQMGEAASRLLGNDVYNVAYRRRLDNIFQEWLLTSPKEKEKREGLWMQAQGLIQMTSDLAGDVNDAQAILERQRQETDPRQQHQQYLDNQGFGPSH